MTTLNRTKGNPWNLKTAPGTAAFTMHTDSKDGLAILVCTVGNAPPLSAMAADFWYWEPE
jgi:hypothetical protein